jgi:hypothetical protein
VADAFFKLSESDRSEALEVAAAAAGRPAHLLEKDVWVVWALSALYQSPIGADLTFKAHVYCAQGRIRGERFARHWHDLAILMQTDYFEQAIADRAVAQAVAKHKSFFFAEKAANGTEISYESAVHGQLQIVPQGEPRTALQADYAKMIEDGVLLGQAIPFDELMLRCQDLENIANQAAG